MARLARGEVLDPDQVQIAHVYNRTVRRCFLIGDDPVSGKNFDHRKGWIESYLREFAGAFGIDLLGFAILSNHFHLILRSRPDVVACAAYVDLNPIRAAMAETIEGSDHTSAQRRIEAMREEAESQQRAGGVTSEVDTSDGNPSIDARSRVSPAEARPAGRTADSFLAPLPVDESRDPTGPCPNPGGSDRCSDKGFLAMSLSDYLQLLDWTARQVAPGEAGKTPEDVPPVVTRLGLTTTAWTELVRDFSKLFASVAGQPSCVDATRSVRTHRRFRVRRRVRELLAA